LFAHFEQSRHLTISQNWSKWAPKPPFAAVCLNGRYAEIV